MKKISEQPLTKDRIVKIIESLKNKFHSDLDPVRPSLELDVIAEVCANVWECTAEQITGKYNPNIWAESVRRDTFMAASLLFSNKTPKEVAVICRSTGAYVTGRFRHLDIGIRHGSSSKQMLTIYAKLDGLCPGRLESFYKIVPLICINDGDVTVSDGTRYSLTASPVRLNFLGRYTATELIKNNSGHWCYRINELDAQEYVADRFFVTEDEPGI